MKKHWFSISYLVLCILSVSAQKEAYFNTKKPEDIKVESLHGFEVGLSLLPSDYYYGLLSFPNNFNPSLYVGYFHEKRIADCWTLNLTVGLHNIAMKSPNLQVFNDSVNGTYIGGLGSKTSYALALELGLEPRWYWGYKSRYQFGKAQLNSGWFFSFPLLFQTTLLHTPVPIIGQGWYPKGHYTGSFVFVPTVGYRKAVSKQCFLEGSAGLGAIINMGTNNMDNHFNISTLVDYVSLLFSSEIYQSC